MSVHIAEVTQIFFCIVAGIPVTTTPLQISPPTFIKTNEYTEACQDIINSYGIPGYQKHISRSSITRQGVSS